jgi:hypothetical protein
MMMNNDKNDNNSFYMKKIKLKKLPSIVLLSS